MTTGPVDHASGDEPASLQARLESARPAGSARPGSETEGPSIADPVALFRHLESSRRFRRDTGIGRIFHPGELSFRESRPTDSLHVVINGNRIKAHVDQVSPLEGQARRPARYSLRRAVAHNLAGMAHDLILLLRGRQGDHRSEIDCEWSWDPGGGPHPCELLDRETAAWSVQIEAEVDGELDEARLRTALTGVLRRRPCDHDPLWVVDCIDEEAVDAARAALHGRPAGLDEWPPLRAGLARRPGAHAFMLNVNHAAGDGFDALRLLRRVASAYATGTDPDPPPDFPTMCDLPVRAAAPSESAAMARYRSTVERLRNHLARPAQLAPDGAEDDSSFGFHRVCLSAEVTRLVVDADRAGTSRNLLLTGLHLAIGRWNLEHGGPGGRIGVLVPVDLRPPGWAKETVGNFSVTARVSTSRRQRSHATAALKAVTAQTTRNKRTRTGIALLAALERSGLVALWAKQSPVVLQPVTRNRLVDTALLANLGWQDEVPSFGNGAGETVHVWFSLPARAPLTLCVGVVTVAGQLHLVLRYSRRLFSDSSARRFADRFVTEIAGSTTEG